MTGALRLCLLFAAAAHGVAENAGAPLEVPFFRQEKNGCGAASAAMVAHYWASRVPQPANSMPSPAAFYSRLFDAEIRGVLLSEMRRYLQELGFHAFTFRGRWSDLETHLSKGRPLIIGLKKGGTSGLHFAVVTGTYPGGVWLNDPTRKRAHRQKQAEFEKQWESGGSWILLATPASAD